MTITLEQWYLVRKKVQAQFPAVFASVKLQDGLISFVDTINGDVRKMVVYEYLGFVKP